MHTYTDVVFCPLFCLFCLRFEQEAEAHKALYYHIGEQNADVYFVDNASDAVSPVALTPSDLRHFFSFKLAEDSTACFEVSAVWRT